MKIDIIGTGNVATHLFKALGGKADVNIVPSRTLVGLRGDSDTYLISVSDTAIAEVAEKVSELIPTESVLAHTSGSTPISVLSRFHKNIGVFYPLQTFSKNVPLAYSEIPFFIEGSTPQVTDALKSLALKISEKVYEADSDDRRNLHIASVFACNFVNHLWTLADSYLESKNLSFDALRPLIKETCRKIQDNRPRYVQTGPAARHDKNIINEHLQVLSKENSELSDIYDTLTRSIIKHH